MRFANENARKEFLDFVACPFIGKHPKRIQQGKQLRFGLQNYFFPSVREKTVQPLVNRGPYRVGPG
jgi:hypothetical protein